MKFRKIISMFLITATVCAMMAGCSEKNETVGTDTKPVIKQLNPYIKEDYNTYPVAEVVEEVTGYKVQYDMLPQEKWEDKLNLIMTSGDSSYDCITIKGIGRARYIDFANQGALTDLTDLIEKYGQNIIKSVGRDMLETAKVNGKIYGIPTGGGADPDKPIINEALAVRKDLIERAGIKMPETIDEFTEFLREIKEKDPNGNGSSTIPLTISSTGYNIPGLLGAFGVPVEIMQVNGTLIDRIELPQYKEYLQYLNQLYNEGLLDNEFPVNKTATVNEKFTSGKAIIMPFGWVDASTNLSALKANQPGAEVEYMIPPKGKNGEQGFGCVMGSYGWDLISFIPKSCKYPEEVIKYIDAKLETNNFRKISIGEEGVHYTVEDDKYYPILPKFFDEKSYSNYYSIGVDRENYPKYWLARLRKDEVMYNTFEQLNDTVLKPYLIEVRGTSGMPLSIETANNMQVMNQIISDYAIKFICGTESFDNYDKFIKEWKEAGGERYTKELQEWYKEKQSQ